MIFLDIHSENSGHGENEMNENLKILCYNEWRILRRTGVVNNSTEIK